MKNKLFIYIPTRGHIDKQKTLENIPNKWKKYTKLVIGEKDSKNYVQKFGKDLIMPCPYQGIFNVRQWIIENSYSKFSLFLDDDMTFNIRKNKRLLKCNMNEVDDLFNLLHNWLLKGIIHVGISSRQHNFCVNDSFTEISRMNNAYAYNVEKLIETKVKFNRLEVMEDFDVTLSLLELGFKNRVTYKYAWGQVASGAKGGCSIYRTQDVQSKAAYKLKELHPNVVKIKIKTSKTLWNGIDSNKRTDVIISWKKSFIKKSGITNFFNRGKII